MALLLFVIGLLVGLTLLVLLPLFIAMLAAGSVDGRIG